MKTILLLAGAIAAPAPKPPPVPAPPATAAMRPATSATPIAPRPPPPPPAPLPPAAQAPSPGPPARSLAGAWRLTDVGGKIDCTLTLSEHLNPAGRDIEAPIACQRAFPPLKTLTAWSAGAHGAPVFSGVGGRRTVAFSGPVGGPYSAVAPDGKPWRLTAAPTKPHPDLTP